MGLTMQLFEKKNENNTKRENETPRLLTKNVKLAEFDS